MVWSDADNGGRAPSGSGSAPSGPGPNGAWPAFRDSGSPPPGPRNFTGPSGGTASWQYVTDAKVPAWYVVPTDYANGLVTLGEAPAGYVWGIIDVDATHAYATLFSRDAAGGDPLHPNIPAVTTGPLTTIPSNTARSLAPGLYRIVVDVTIDRWHGFEDSLLTVPAGKQLVLTNPLTDFTVSGPFAGILKQSRSVSVSLQYQQIFGDPTVTDPSTFWSGMRSQWANRSATFVSATGDFGLDTSTNTWTLIWPTVTGAGNALGSGMDALNAIGAWLVKWGPWIILALGAVLAFFLLPYIVLMLLKAITAWQSVAVLVGALA